MAEVIMCFFGSMSGALAIVIYLGFQDTLLRRRAMLDLADVKRSISGYRTRILLLQPLASDYCLTLASPGAAAVEHLRAALERAESHSRRAGELLSTRDLRSTIKAYRILRHQRRVSVWKEELENGIQKLGRMIARAAVRTTAWHERSKAIKTLQRLDDARIFGLAPYREILEFDVHVRELTVQLRQLSGSGQQLSKH